MAVDDGGPLVVELLAVVLELVLVRFQAGDVGVEAVEGLGVGFEGGGDGGEGWRRVVGVGFQPQWAATVWWRSIWWVRVWWAVRGWLLRAALTAKDAVADRVKGLEGGADDYVTKPFSFEELLARIRVRLRDPGAEEVTLLRAGGLMLDLRTRCVDVGERTVELTAREFALTETLIRHSGQVLSRAQLLSHVWGYDFDPGSNVVEVYIRHLRRKLGAQRIETVRGMGYRLRAVDGG